MMSRTPKPPRAAPSGQPDSASVCLVVRTAAAQGDLPRYRAGIGPFGVAPVTVTASPAQAAALRADSSLIVVEAQS